VTSQHVTRCKIIQVNNVSSVLSSRGIGFTGIIMVTDLKGGRCVLSSVAPLTVSVQSGAVGATLSLSLTSVVAVFGVSRVSKSWQVDSNEISYTIHDILRSQYKTYLTFSFINEY